MLAQARQSFGGSLTKLLVALAAAFLLLGASVANAGLLHDAAGDGDIEQVKKLLAQGADPNELARFVGTPLHLVSISGQVEVASALIEAGADVDATTQTGVTPLQRAASKGQEAVAKLLIGEGADVNAKDNAGSTPLFDAVKGNRPALVRLLINNGADLNVRGGGAEVNPTPLQWTSMEGYTEVAGLLVSGGADVDARDDIDRTSLHWAAIKGQKEMAELLIAAGAKLDLVGGDTVLETPLESAVRMGNNDIAELLRHGATE